MYILLIVVFTIIKVHPFFYCHHVLHIIGELLFENNKAKAGAGIVIDHSTVMFGENCNTKFINNTVDKMGAAIFLKNTSNAIFDSNSKVTFTDNTAPYGTIYSVHNSSVIFNGTSNITFSRNSATKCGAAIFSHGSHVLFTGYATVRFTNNFVYPNNISDMGWWSYTF